MSRYIVLYIDTPVSELRAINGIVHIPVYTLITRYILRLLARRSRPWSRYNTQTPLYIYLYISALRHAQADN